MRIIGKVLFAILATIFMAQLCLAEETPKELTLQISQAGSEYVLTVPVSRLILKLPKDSFSVVNATSGGSTNSPRYFHLESDSQNVTISGWFESAADYSSFSKYWNEEKESWRRARIPEPINESPLNVNGWDGVLYDISIPKVSNSHIRAHFVQAGTWIDLHISTTSTISSSEARKAIVELLKRIKVEKKA